MKFQAYINPARIFLVSQVYEGAGRRGMICCAVVSQYKANNRNEAGTSSLSTASGLLCVKPDTQAIILNLQVFPCCLLPAYE